MFNRKPLTEKINSDLDVLEKTVTQKQTLLSNALNENEQKNIQQYIDTIRQITQRNEFKQLSQTVKDFDSLKKYLKNKLPQNSGNISLFLNSLEEHVNYIRQLLQQEESEEQNQEPTKEELQKEVKYMQASLQYIQESENVFSELVKMFSQQKRNEDISKKEYEKRLKWLKGKGLDLKKFTQKQLEDLIRNKFFDIVHLGEKAGRESEEVLFKYGIPKITRCVEHFWKEYNWNIWPDLVQLGKEAGDKAGNLFTFGIPTVMPWVEDFWNKYYWNIWPDLVHLGKKAGEDSGILFRFEIHEVLSWVEHFWKEYKWNIWPDLVQMGEQAGENAGFLFEYGISEVLPKVEHFWKEYNWNIWPYLVQMGEQAGENAGFLFEYGISEVLPCIEHFWKEYNWNIWPDIVQIGKKAGKNSYYLLEKGIPTIGNVLTNKNFEKLTNCLLEILDYTEGVKGESFEALEEIKPYIDTFKENLFEEFIMPSFRIQTVGTFRSFELIATETIQNAVLNYGDPQQNFEIIKHINTKHPFTAYDILNNIIKQGLENGAINFLADENELLQEFLKKSPLHLLEGYQIFKQYKETNPDKVDELFRNYESLKQDIIEGEISQEYNEELLTGAIYNIFPPMTSIDRNEYQKLTKEREDRNNDIPEKIRNLKKQVKIKAGTYKLEGEIDTSYWNTLVNVVKDTSQEDFDYAEFGIKLLRAYNNNQISENRYYILQKLYQVGLNHGNGLPEFKSDMNTLVAYKEFIADTINNYIYEVLQAASERKTREFDQIMPQEQKDFSGLAKAILGPLNSDKSDLEKDSILKNILRNNQFNVADDINIADKFANLLEGKNKSEYKQAIENWLNENSSRVIEKGTVQRIVNGIFGKEYEGMQNEMSKYKFKGSKKDKQVTFTLSKKKLHSCAMFNMGVCIAPDNLLWNQVDFWQMIIFDEGVACGGVLYRTIEEDNKKYLVLVIEPNDKILTLVAPDSLYDKIIQFSNILRKKLGYHHLIIPTSDSIHSNRGSIQQVISNRSSRYKTISMKNTYDFSYEPYNSTYDEFYVVK